LNEVQNTKGLRQEYVRKMKNGTVTPKGGGTTIIRQRSFPGKALDWGKGKKEWDRKTTSGGKGRNRRNLIKNQEISGKTKGKKSMEEQGVVGGLKGKAIWGDLAKKLFRLPNKQ